MGNPVPDEGAAEDAELKRYKIDMSHQEMERLVRNMLEIWEAFSVDPEGNPTGLEWLPVEGIGMALCDDLGYEDMGEFEDAMTGTFCDFLDKLPRIQKRRDEPTGKWFFKVLPEPPQSEWRPTRMTYHIINRRDLWRVCFKSQYARAEIPELEFEISADGKRAIDSIYNHIAGAIFNLGQHAAACTRSGNMSDEYTNKILDTVIALNVLLDVEKPFTLIVHDPSGLSEFNPKEGVLVEYL